MPLFPDRPTDGELATLDGRYAPAVVVDSSFGDGVTDATAHIQAKLDATPAGGVLYFPPGEYLVANGGLSHDQTITIQGAGCGDYEDGGARLICTSATATLLTLSATGCRVFDLAFINESATRPTAGVGLLFTDNDWGRVERCLFRSFYVQAQVDSGYFYSFSKNAFLGPVDCGLYMRNTASGQHDHADQIVEGNNFSKYGDTTDGGTAVRWASGGGLRLVGNKINAGRQPGYTDTGFWTDGIVAPITAGATSVMVVSGNSIEGFLTDGIRVAPLASSSFGKIAITGNEFMSSGSGGWAINLDGSLATNLRNVTVTGNVAYGEGRGINASKVDGLVVVGNDFDRCSGTYMGLTKVQRFQQANNLFSTNVQDNDHSDFTSTTAGKLRGKWTARKDVIDLSGGPTSFGSIRIGQYSNGILTVRVAGQVKTVGAATATQRRRVSKGASTTSVATIGTDEADGPGSGQIAITYDTTTDTALVVPKIEITSSGVFVGTIEIEYEGVIYIFTPPTL